MMGYGGQSSSDGANAGGDLLYPGCELNPPPLTTHDSGIDMSPHDLDSHGSDSQEVAMIRTQEIEYQDISSSSENSHASFSEALTEFSSKPKKSSGAVDRRTRRRRSPPKATFDFNDNSLVSVYTFFKTFLG